MTFYSALFDLIPDKIAQDYARFTIHDPPLVLSLNEAPNEPLEQDGSRHVEHFGVRLSSQQLHAAHQRLSAAQLIRKVQERTQCCYATQNKIWARDPDGNDWEFYELVEDFQPATNDDASRTRAGACCS